MTPAEQLSAGVEQRRSDRNAALGESGPGLVDGDAKKGAVVQDGF
jgi:hypothetical protein